MDPSRLPKLLKRAVPAALARASRHGRARRPRGSIFPEAGGGSQQARGHPHALRDHLRARPHRLPRRRGRAHLVPGQVPRQAGPRRRPDPRQHEARDRLDRRRRGDPRLPDDRHVRDAARASRTRPRPTSTSTATRSPPTPPSPRPTSASRRTAQSMNIQVNGKQYVWQFTYPGDDEGLLLHAHVRAGRDDGHARHPLRRRAALVVDPGARRQDGRAARATRTRPGSRSTEPGDVLRASAPSCAGATTRTCTPRSSRCRSTSGRQWYDDEAQEIKDAEEYAAEEREQLEQPRARTRRRAPPARRTPNTNEPE